MGTKKIVLRIDVYDDKNKQKVLKTVSTLYGVDSVSVDMKDGKVMVIGLVDPVDVVTKLRKNGWPCADLIAISPWPEKKDGGDMKMDVGGGSGNSGGARKKKNKDGGKEQDAPKPQLAWHPPPEWHKEQPSYQQRPRSEWQTEHPSYQQGPQYQYAAPRAEKNPNDCVIC